MGGRGGVLGVPGEGGQVFEGYGEGFNGYDAESGQGEDGFEGLQGDYRGERLYQSEFCGTAAWFVPGGGEISRGIGSRKSKKKYPAEKLDGRGFWEWGGRKFQKRFGRKVFTLIFASAFENNSNKA